MTVSTAVIIPSKTAEAAITAQYTSTNLTTIIDKFTATNYTAGAETLTVCLINAGGTAGADNAVTLLKTLQAGETYTFPELVGQVLASGDFISTEASATPAISIRASGRVIS